MWVQSCFHRHQFVDNWRAHIPTTKDYTYRSQVHDVNTRIPMVKHGYIEAFATSAIGDIFISDHTPIFVSLQFTEVI